MADMLLIDCIGCASLSLNESTNGSVRFRGKFQEANQVNKNKRLYPYDVLAENVEKMKETISGRGLFGELDHPCLTDSNFSVLTVNGWKPFSEIREGDYVFSRVNGKMVKSRVNGIINKPYDGPVYHVKGRAIDCTFSPEHKFLLNSRYDSEKEEYTTIKEIHNNREKYNKFRIPKTATWGGGNRESVFTIKGITRKTRKDYSRDLAIDAKKFAAFMGIYLAEGSLKGSNRVEICQVNECGKELIREMLVDFHSEIEWKEFKNGFYTVDARLHDYLVPLGNKYNKYIPFEVKSLDPICLKELLKWFVIGDGRALQSNDGGKTCFNCKDVLDDIELKDHSRISMFSVSKTLVDDLHECLVKVGLCGARSVIEAKKDYVFADRVIESKNKKPLYQLSISRSKFVHMDSRFLRVTEKHHTGRIYCLMTQFGNFYMEYKGKSFWTGNCDSIVHLSNASHLVTKLWWEGNVLMGEGEVLNTPSGKVLKSLIECGVRVGISSRGVGNGQVNNEGVLVIGESYKLITFDAVADPSTFSAFQSKILNKKESVSPNAFQSATSYQPKVETVSKTKADPKALISYFGQILQKRLNEVKEQM